MAETISMERNHQYEEKLSVWGETISIGRNYQYEENLSVYCIYEEFNIKSRTKNNKIEKER